MTVLQAKRDWTARLLDPWGVGSLAAFTVTKTLLSIYGFAAGVGSTATKAALNPSQTPSVRRAAS